MSDMVLMFRELKGEQRLSAGGKGGTLARLYQAGYPVPDGFVILPAAFADEELLPEAWEQAQDHLHQMCRNDAGTTVAVRSSALPQDGVAQATVSEDSAQASFAGEFETVLNVGADQTLRVREAIHTVRRSRRSRRVQAYSQAQGLDVEYEMAVVVQKMVQADISGVLFTADPVTGSWATMMGNFVRGLGDRLVSGEVSGQAFSIKRPKGQYEGPAELERFARRLYKLASRLEKDLGCPQDIEWAVAGDETFLLQSRPITTLQGHNPATGEWNDSLTGDFLWTNVNVGEGTYCVMTPFTWSVIRDYFEQMSPLPGYSPLGNIGGRMYNNLSLTASALRVLGKDLPEQFMELGGAEKPLPEGMTIPIMPLSRSSLLTILPGVIRLLIKQRVGIRELPAFVAGNRAWCDEVRQRIQAVESQRELAALWQETIWPVILRRFWTVAGSAMRYSEYTAQLRRELTQLVGAGDASTLLSNVSSGTDLLACLGPVLGLAKVAGGQMSREAYLERYGHRGPYEVEMSIPRPAEDPDWLDEQLAEFAASPVDVEGLLARQRSEFDHAWGRFKDRYPRRARSLRRRLERAAEAARMRESTRSEWTRLAWGVSRAFALRVGELIGLGENVFFFTIAEVLDLLAGEDAATAYIPARRETHARYNALPPYPAIINGRFDPFQWAADPDRRSDFFDSHTPHLAPSHKGLGSGIITGSPGSAGRVEGVVRRLDSPEASDQLRPGEILVTAQTNIGWTLLFPRTAAIVTDVGAPLSHAAIVARELGIPAVVGCGDATMRLESGDLVRVDGAQGVVEILGRVE
jgi:phosphohistidine swiveling domain-containing protein